MRNPHPQSSAHTRTAQAAAATWLGRVGKEPTGNGTCAALAFARRIRATPTKPKAQTDMTRPRAARMAATVALMCSCSDATAPLEQSRPEQTQSDGGNAEESPTDGSPRRPDAAPDAASPSSPDSAAPDAALPPQNAPIALAAGHGHTCMLTQKGDVYCWGYNESGQVGDGTQTDRIRPAKVAGLGTVKAIAAGYAHTCALELAGTIQCWGHGYLGELGNNAFADSVAPVPVLGITGATQISAGVYATCTVVGGAAKCWGARGTSGQLGDGQTGGQVGAPVQVIGSESGVETVSLAFGYRACLLASGTAGNQLRCWGTSATSTPAAVSTQLRPVALHGSLLIAQGGVYQIDGTNEPAPIAGLAGATMITNYFRNSCAVMAGRPYCWGSNEFGQAGSGTRTPVSSPTLVAGVSGTVTALASGVSHTCAIADEKVWCWGANDRSQTGRPSTPVELQPAQVAFVP